MGEVAHALRSSAFRKSTQLVIAIVVAITTLGVVTPAQANLAGSSFEGNDGNLVVNATGNKDWVNAPNFDYGIDKVANKKTGAKDDSFAGGTDEDTVNPGTTFGAIPNSKDDLSRFYISHEQIGSGSTAKTFLYLAWIRNQVGGSADMDFEFNQSADTYATGLPVRQTGDMLITYEFISQKT